MIWATWRQHRTTILATVGGILLLAAVAAVCGLEVRNATSPEPFGSFFGCAPGGGAAECWAESTLTLITLVTVVLPVLLGVLVGVTVFSRDIEHGTHVLGFSQSVSRARWYWTRVLVVFVPAVLAMVVLGSVLEWTRDVAVGPDYAFVSYSWVGYSHLTFPLFQSTGLIAGAYTLLALILGSLLGMLLRNTLGAMTVTLVAMTALLVGFQVEARPQYATPVVETRPLDNLGHPSYSTPDIESGGPVWILSAGYVDAAGRSIDLDHAVCNEAAAGNDWGQRPDETLAAYEARQDSIAADQDRVFTECRRVQGVDRFEMRYHPDTLFRRFQLTEAALALALSALLLIPSMWVLRRLRP
ncbi:ABC transporter permease [Prescottella defluvii]|uniref:ABC transporter permease n=1 Tax=Prescottella defluvii TaxID=1323361 RepID=UPI0004F34727|nr:ABC transporter permease [Prescottella defluvii]